MSPMAECEPEVEYNLSRGLTEEEFDFIQTAINNEINHRNKQEE